MRVESMKKASFYFVLSSLLLGSLLLLLEGTCHLLLTHPQWLRHSPSNFRSHFVDYYLNHHRGIIQNQGDHASWDLFLGYRLRPGLFTFSNLEFSNRFKVNSQGFRDDEDSLVAPEIIVLGDSYAMGWGVEQNQVFADVLEAQTQIKVLNTAVSSYSTVRQLRVLEEVDRSGLRYLIISYCNNDDFENANFRRGSRIRESWFVEQVETEKRRTSYFLGKYFQYMIKPAMGRLVRGSWSSSVLEDQRLAETKERERLYQEGAKSFLKVLDDHRDLLEKPLKIFVLNFQWEQSPSGLPFDGQLFDTPGWERWKDQVVQVPFRWRAGETYILDSHLNHKAHHRIAMKLAELIGEHPPSELRVAAKSEAHKFKEPR